MEANSQADEENLKSVDKAENQLPDISEIVTQSKPDQETLTYRTSGDAPYAWLKCLCRCFYSSQRTDKIQDFEAQFLLNPQEGHRSDHHSL